MIQTEDIGQDKVHKSSDLDTSWDLQFVRVRLPQNVRLIPSELIEQVKRKTFTVEQFYKYQEAQLLAENQANWLTVLVKDKTKIEGFVWVEINQMDGTMFINTFSITKEYWHQGKALPKVMEYLESVRKAHNSPQVFWITPNPKFFSKHGFRQSKNVLMEYSPLPEC